MDFLLNTFKLMTKERFPLMTKLTQNIYSYKKIHLFSLWTLLQKKYHHQIFQVLKRWKGKIIKICTEDTETNVYKEFLFYLVINQ
jgi:hypothetical protein